MSGLWMVVILSVFSAVPLRAAELPQAVRVVAHSNGAEGAVPLSESDWSFARGLKLLRLGVSSPEFMPFDITVSKNEVEGITADFASQIAKLLHLKLEVKIYSSRIDAIQALKQGDIDILGTANRHEAADAALLLSQPYARDKPVFVTRSNDAGALEPLLGNKKLAMQYRYLPSKTVLRDYPKATLQLYDSAMDALGAVAFGQADVYLGDAISASYMIDHSYRKQLEVAEYSNVDVNHFSFALARGNERLVGVINVGLRAIPSAEKATILRRWSSPGTSIPMKYRTHFSVAERLWLDRQSRLNVVIKDGFLPFTYLDKSRGLRGISADVLEIVSQRTGLQFDVHLANSSDEIAQQIAEKRADVALAMVTNTQREGVLSFTRPYLATPFVLVGPIGTVATDGLTSLSGQRVALERGSGVLDWVAVSFPAIEWVDVESAEQAMEKVSSGKAQAAIVSLVGANFMIADQYRDRLRITSTIPAPPARFSFAVSREAVELSAVLNKVISSLSQAELKELNSRWREAFVIDDGNARALYVWILQGGVGGGILLLMGTVWIFFQRRLLRRRVEAEQALNDQLEFTHAVIDSTPHPIYVCDTEGRLLTFNSDYLKASGLSREALTGRRAMDVGFVVAAEAESYLEDFKRVVNRNQPLLQDMTLTAPDGQLMTLFHWMIPSGVGSDGVRAVVAGWIDITMRADLLTNLRVAQASAEDANRAKTTFLATMSHEIRTPVNAVIGMLELAQRKAEQGELDRNAIEVASGAAKGLLGLLGNILDIAQIETGCLTLNPARTNLLELVESVLNIFEVQARQKSIRLVREIQLPLGNEVVVDSLRIRQILTNLLSNAIKFTSEGEVRLTARTIETLDETQLTLLLRVEDTGRGISHDDQQRLFVPFTQADGGNEHGVVGSGLGLVICRTLCDLMGGELTLHSRPGEGTQVELRLEVQCERYPEEPLQESSESSVINHGLQVLVADDYPANRRLLSQQLGMLGHHVVCANDGAYAYQLWCNGNFDVVITDCNMPVMDGYQLAKAIRQYESLHRRASCLIVGFTANALSDEKQQCLNSGMDDCLFKPITINDLKIRLDVMVKRVGVAAIAPEAAGRMHVDMSSVEDFTRGNPVLIRRLLEDLARSTDDDLSLLPSLLVKRDIRGLRNLAHKIKGGARIIDAHSLIAACEQLERVCKQRGPDADLERQVQVLQIALSQLAKSLREYLARV